MLNNACEALLALPIRTTLTDIEAFCRYLITKPTGATIAEAKAVLDEKVLDGRKLSAMKYWGMIEDASGKFKLTDRGRLIAKDKGAVRPEALRQVIASVPPYIAIVERAVHKKEQFYSATDVAAHWHQHFRDASSESDKILNDQAVCFFQLAEGADLGRLVIGRKGQPTRFEFDEANATVLIEGGHYRKLEEKSAQDEPEETVEAHEVKTTACVELPKVPPRSKRVFITHGKNKKILEQVKDLVAYGKFEPVIAQERETSAKPVPEKVMDEMRGCYAAVIHVGVDEVLLDKEGQARPLVNGNVLIEIGAAMALYGRNFILLVEDGVKLPSNLQGLYECRYKGDELNHDAIMKLLKAFNEFK